MADLPTVAIAKAVEAKIRGTTLSKEFTLERSYADWELDLSEMEPLTDRDADKLRVDVVSHTTEQRIDQIDRDEIEYTCPIDIAVRKKFGPDAQNEDTGRVEVAAIDELMLLVGEIVLLFLDNDGASYGGGTLSSNPQIVAAPVRQHLREWRQFTGLIRLPFLAYVKVN